MVAARRPLAPPRGAPRSRRGGETPGVGVGAVSASAPQRRRPCATCSEGAVESPTRALPVLLVGVPGVTNARSPEAA